MKKYLTFLMMTAGFCLQNTSDAQTQTTSLDLGTLDAGGGSSLNFQGVLNIQPGSTNSVAPVLSFRDNNVPDGSTTGDRVLSFEAPQTYVFDYTFQVASLSLFTTTFAEVVSSDQSSITIFQDSSAIASAVLTDTSGSFSTFSLSPVTLQTGSVYTIEIAAPNYTGTYTGNMSWSSVQGNLTAVPEPSTYGMIAGLSALGLLLVRRRAQLA